MSTQDDDRSSPHSQLSAHCFDELLDSIIADVASEYHRIVRLALDRGLDEEEEEMRLSEQARKEVAEQGCSGETGTKYVVDIFGQTHPAIADEIFECMNCGRPIMAGRFAPHLEKCMGKGRKARRTTRSSAITRSRHSHGSPISVYAPYSSSTGSRVSNGASGGTGEEYADRSFEEL